MNNDLVPDAENSTTLGNYRIVVDPTMAPDEWKLSTEHDSVEETSNFVLSMFRTLLEQSYVLGKITKTELIERLRKLYNEEGLDISEAIEEIEQSKDKFYQEITEHVRQQLDTRRPGI